jgi:PPOX class probable F420-dependent enzyme
MLDLNTPNGQRADRRLREEPVIWLTTINAAGQPQTSPVWFLWDGQSILVYSRPNQKVRNVTRHPRVALNLNHNGHGGDIVSIEGTAMLDRAAPPAHRLPAYVEKYAEGIRRIGMEPAGFAAAYSQVIRVTPLRIRVW